MTRDALFNVIFCVAALTSSAAHAQQAVVRSLDTPDLEIGQAWLMRSGSQCVAVLPQHVVAEARHPSLLREGNAGLRGDAVTMTDLGDDAAFATMNGNITRECGFSIGSISRNIERHLRDGGMGTLRSINGDGTVGRLPVTVVDDDGSQLLRVMPTVEHQGIHKGLSGSLLYVNEQPVGMLLSVHARSGVGTVLRTDVLLAKVEQALRSTSIDAAASKPTVPAMTSSSGGTATSSTSSNPWQIVSWNVDASDSSSLAGNLTAAVGITENGWRAAVARWPVVLDLGGVDSVRIVQGLRFIAGSSAAAELPAKIQILTTASADNTAWRSVSSDTLQFVQGVAEIKFLPVRARQLRVEIYGAQQSTNRVALTRMLVLEGERQR